MNRYLLLILLSSWAHVVPLSLQCETGVAYPKHVLSVPRSLMANADVAILKTYKAETLDKCITDCCAEKFGEKDSFNCKLLARIYFEIETQP